jgi:hypothetical protein
MQREKISFSTLIIFIIFLCVAGFSKADSNEKINKTKKWLELLHMDQGLKREIDQTQESIRSHLPPDLQKDFQQCSTILFDKQEIMNEFFIPFFSEQLTEDDLDKWIYFYSSTIGQSIINKQATIKAKQNEIIQKTMASIKDTKAELPSVNLNDPKYAKSLRLSEVLDYKKIHGQMLRMISQVLPPDSYAKFKEVFTEHYYISCMLILFEDVYTEEELDAAIDFFSSTAHKHFTKNLLEIMQNSQVQYVIYMQSRIVRLKEEGKIPENLATYLLKKED